MFYTWPSIVVQVNFPSTWLQHVVGWPLTATLNNAPELILWVPTWRWFQQETGWRLWWAAGGPLRSSPSPRRRLLRWPARHCGPPAWPGSLPPSPSAAGRSPPAPVVRGTEELVHLLSCASSHGGLRLFTCFSTAALLSSLEPEARISFRDCRLETDKCCKILFQKYSIIFIDTNTDI